MISLQVITQATNKKIKYRFVWSIHDMFLPYSESNENLYSRHYTFFVSKNSLLKHFSAKEDYGRFAVKRVKLTLLFDYICYCYNKKMVVITNCCYATNSCNYKLLPCKKLFLAKLQLGAKKKVRIPLLGFKPK